MIIFAFCAFPPRWLFLLFDATPSQHAGYWRETNFLSEVDRNGETTYYDSVTGKPLFIAPRGRTFQDFEKESLSHGWPSFRGMGLLPPSLKRFVRAFYSVFLWFLWLLLIMMMVSSTSPRSCCCDRGTSMGANATDEEVVWENMRCLSNGESVSVDGTHLGHNLPVKNRRFLLIQDPSV
jgi:hypothetical protein